MKIIEQNEHVVEVAVVIERRDGTRYRSSLNGEDARKWDRYTDVLTDVARAAGAYPPFHALQWNNIEEPDAAHPIADSIRPDFARLALKVAEAYPHLNLSDAPLNPRGELVLNIARIIEEEWRSS